jgi:hypothetical protein
MAQYKDDNLYFTAAQMEPEMHPLMQVGMSLAPYGIMAAGSYYAMYTPLRANSNMSLFDYAASMLREKAAKTPMGLANTFRLPELMSFFTSPEFKGMDVSESSISPGRNVGKEIYGSNFFKNKDQLKYLEAVIGKETFDRISQRMTGDDFRIVLEQGLEQRGSASLVFEELEYANRTVNNKVIQDQVVKQAELLTDRVTPFVTLNYEPEILDLVEGKRIEKQLQPIGRAAISNLDIGVDPGNIFKYYEAGGREVTSSVGFVPSMTSNTQPGIQGLRNKSAVALSYLTAGMSRFNKVVKATFEQVPVLGNATEKTLEAIGIKPYTSPTPFYKQFMELGLKVSAIGAAYMGVRTIDHYRRNFGVAGHLLASASVSGLGAVLAERALRGTALGADKSLPTKVGLGLFALQMFPGFSQGTVEGIATSFVNLDIMKAQVGRYTGMSGYRRTIEGLAPGVSSLEVGAAVGLGLVGASYFGLPHYLARNNKAILPDRLRNRISSSSFTIPRKESEVISQTIFEDFSPRVPGSNIPQKTGIYEKYNQFEEFLTSPEYKKYFEKATKNKAYKDMSSQERKRLGSLLQGASGIIADTYNVSKKEGRIIANKLFMGARTEGRVKFYEEYVENNSVNNALVKSLEDINDRYRGSGFFGKALNLLESTASKAYHAFFGASLRGEDYESSIKKMGGSTHLRRAGILFGAGVLAQQLLTGGLFGSMEDPEELKEIYEGKKLVEIKKGRFWEGGGTPYSGMETNYFRPHQYHLLMTKSQEKSVWGDEHNVYNPISKFILKNFTYHLEEKNYYERPYPITTPGLEGLPVIGPLLGMTVGSLIKPAKFMHEDEFMQVNAQGEVEFAYGEEYGSPSSLGGTPPGKPITPNNLLYRIGQIQYQQRELEGITGYAKNTLQRMFTGRETLGTMMPVMEDSGRMDSSILNYWDMEMGGALFTSEPIRRLLPRPKAEQETYNPIMNSMPSWLPDRFRRGDPYRNIPMGHSRLPGKGYEALYPELEGTPAEEYPLVHKYKILADVAPKSAETFKLRERLMERRAAGGTTEFENQMIDQTLEVHRKQLSSIQDFEFHKNAIKIPGLSDVVSSAYKTGEKAIRKAVAPAEYLVPGGFRPAQKLLGGTRDIVETYEYERLYGTPHAFWDAPIRDWIRPSLYSAANAMGYSGKPLHVQKREEVNEHFDKLQFIKYMSLAEKATNEKDKKRYLGLATRTRSGVNPQGDALSIYMALPEEEKKYFDAFASANASDRDRILEMMPEDQAALYTSIWNRIDTKQNSSLYSGSQAEVNEQELLNKSMELQQEMELPPVDWVGWHKDVDIEDIKLKYISSLGEDIHDYNKFENTLRRLDRRPYLEGSEDFIYIENMPDSTTAYNYMSNYNNVNMRELNITNHRNMYDTSYASLTYNYDRTADVQEQILNALRY